MSGLERNEHINAAKCQAHLDHFCDSIVNILYWDTSLRHCCRVWNCTKTLGRLGGIDIWWYIFMYMYPVGVFQGEWQHVNSIKCAFVLSSCGAVVMEPQVFPQVCGREIKETAIALCRTIWMIWRLERRELESGHFMPWFPSVLSKLIAVEIMFFFAKYCCDRGITVWRVYMFCFAPHCFGQVFLGDLKPLKHQGTTKTLNGNPPLQVCPQNITFKCFVWFALNECIVWAERMITTFDCGPD